jgi:GNAT superfamily N-acetyltransferase
LLKNDDQPSAPPSFQLPGEQVDIKTTFEASLLEFDHSKICLSAFLNKNIQIKRHVPEGSEPVPSAKLRALAITSGVYSRFNIDSNIPKAGFEFMFERWITNSINRSIADEVFVAYENPATSGDEVGFITVKRNGSSVNIGLLAVDEKHRRKGIAHSLLSRAVLWALEQVGGCPNPSINVVTQGANLPAVNCYKSFGFSLKSTQNVYHFWLPRDLKGAVVPADMQVGTYLIRLIVEFVFSLPEFLFVSWGFVSP